MTPNRIIDNVIYKKLHALPTEATNLFFIDILIAWDIFAY